MDRLGFGHHRDRRRRAASFDVVDPAARRQAKPEPSPTIAAGAIDW